ncbi:retrovirus-related pol polyprotein from transposon TNT 1-94, partial [Tanacetum coccineum]
MQTTIVPEQVKTQKIHAGVQVSRLEGKDVIFSIASALEDFILLDFVIVRNIVEYDLLDNVEQDNHAHDQQCAELEIFLRNVQIEYANTQRVGVEVKKANALLTKELETFKERVQFFENKPENKYAYKTAHNEALNHFASEEGLEGSFSISRPKRKSTNVKTSVMHNTNSRSTSKSSKIVEDHNVNASCDSCDVMYVSCAKSMFDNCHEKCVAKYVNSVKHKARRALCTSPLAVKTRFVDASPIAPRASLVVITHVNAKDKASSSRSKSLEFLKVSTPSDTNMFVDRRNDHFAAITSYGYCVYVNITICHVYCVEGLGHNLFFVGQFYYGDLEISFRSKTCYIWNLEGDDLLSGLQESNLYTIFVSDMAALSPDYFMSKASSTKSWLWHRLLSHLNFATINQLAKQDMVVSLLKFKYEKDHLCSACKQGKSKRVILEPKTVTSIDTRLQLLPIDLCDPMRVESINGKIYILVIVDDYSCYTWVYFLRSNDEASEMFKKFITRIQVSLRAIVCYVRTDNGTDFKNEILTSFYEKLDITHQKSIAIIPQRNGVVERGNRCLVEAARTMLIFSNSPDFLWAEAFATACFIQNHLEEELAPTGETSAPPAPKTAKQLAARRIKKEFGGNEESKKMQKNVLKHQFENISTASNESLDNAYDRFQKLISQLEVHGAPISKEDINQKFLRSLSPSWNQIALIMRNKPDIDEIDIDDLYNNLRVYEDEMKRSSSSTSTSQNLAFLSSENTSSTNEVSTDSGDFGVSTTGGISQVSSTPCAHDVACSFFTQATTSPQLVNEDFQQIDEDGKNWILDG